MTPALRFPEPAPAKRKPVEPTPAGSSLEPLRETLRSEPWGVSFFQMVRHLERLYPERKPVGIFVAPADEVVRFSTHTSLSFPASEIQSYTETGPDEPDRLTVNFMGLSAINGPLPHPYVELLLDRVRSGENAVGEFFDLFNHRLISLFYRGWKKSRFFIAFESEGLTHGAGDDAITRAVLDVVGLGTPGLLHRMSIPDHAAIYYAGLLGQTRRSAQGLKQLLEDYFDVQVEIEQFTGGWNRLPPDEWSLLNETGTEQEQLGVATVVGEEVWDQQGTATVRLGPMPLSLYTGFLPGGPAYVQLADWLRFYSRGELAFAIQPVLKRDEVPEMHLGYDENTSSRIGFASWLKTRPFPHDPDDGTFHL